ncbi:S-adenosyl-L-methionine-dependent methyltransferase [Aspergillus venezuelensis]
MESSGPNNSVLALVDDIRNAVLEDNSLTSSAESHSRLLSLVDKLRLTVETPTETVLRLIYQPPQNAAIRTLTDLGVFDLIVHCGEEGISAEELGRRTAAERGLIARLMRIATALGFCSNPAPEIYIANAKTSILTQPIGRDGVRCIYDLTLPTLSRLPSYFTEHRYTLPNDYTSSPMHWVTGQSQFEWLADRRHQQVMFNSYMGSRRAGRKAWFDVYPAERLMGSHSVVEGDGEGGEEGVFIVDIGGNRGHDLIRLREERPDLKGRFVLQDLPAVVNAAVSDEGNRLESMGIEAMGYSFFEEQPVKGARTYYLRSILHDWPDDKALTILRNIVSAMNPAYSWLIIVDFVLPDTEIPLMQAALDIQMMCIGAGVERSKREWAALLGKVGLGIRGVWNMGAGLESVIEAGLIQDRDGCDGREV